MPGEGAVNTRDWSVIAMRDPLTVSGVIRKLWLAEAMTYRDHLLRLDDDARRLRFGGAVSDERLHRHAEAALEDGAIVHGFFVDGVLRGAAELRIGFGGEAHRAEAEAAFSVEPGYRNSGIGSALLGRTLLAARNRGVRLLAMICLPSNRPMQALARKHEASIRYNLADVVGELTTPGPTPLSLLREMVADGHSVAATILDAQARALRPN